MRYKARLVAKGYAQRKGTDYHEVFSPVVKHSSIRILLALVAQYELDLDQLDVKTTFLHCDLHVSANRVQDCRERRYGVQAEEIAVWVKTVS